MPEPSVSTPLVSDASPELVSRPDFKWYHYVASAIAALFPVAVLFDSLASFWTFLFALATLVALAKAFHLTIYTLKPQTLNNRFILTQALLAIFMTPIATLVLSVPFLLCAYLILCIAAAIVLFLFSSSYPEAAQAWANDLFSYAPPSDPTSGPARIVSTTIRSSVHAAKTAWHQHTSTSPHPAELPILPKDFVAKIWNDMVAAGASTVAMVLVLVVLALLVILFTITIVVGKHSINEYIKWKLLRRYKAVTNDFDSAARELGVAGIVFIACTGAFAMSLVRALFTIFVTAEGNGSIFNALCMTAVILLDVAILVGSQLVVATAHAEVMVLEKDSTLWRAFRTSVLYNAGLSILRMWPVFPMIMPLSEVIIFFFFTAVRALFVYHFSHRFVARMKAALNEEASVA